MSTNLTQPIHLPTTWAALTVAQYLALVTPGRDCYYVLAATSQKEKVQSLRKFLATYKATCRFSLGLPELGQIGFAVRGDAWSADGELVAVLSILLPTDAERNARQAGRLAAVWAAADVEKQ